MARLAFFCFVALAAFGADAHAAPSTSSTYTRTRYPIVLAPGMGGFGAFDYWHGVVSELLAGGATVYVANLSVFGSAEARGEELLEQIEYFTAASGGARVNIIAHSQGGLDARYVLAVRPDLVASLTTVGTPHRGADLADALLEHITPTGLSGDVVSVLGGSLGTVLELLAGTRNPQDAVGALQAVSSAELDAFNRRYPDGLATTRCGAPATATKSGTPLYSWTGTSVFTNVLDPFDLALGAASVFSSEASDGLVQRCSARFGRVLRDDYAMNHADEINQLSGLVSIFETNPLAVYRAHANRLRNAGL